MATEYPFTKQTFIQAVRKKTGSAYSDLEDDKLFSSVTNKYPQYVEQIDPTSLTPVAPVEKPGLMTRLLDAAKGMFGGGGDAPAPLASPALAAPQPAVQDPAPVAIAPPLDPAEIARLVPGITATPEAVHEVFLAQAAKARETAMDAGAVDEWLKAKKNGRKFNAVTRIDPVAALEVGAAKADPVNNLVRNAPAGELVGREIRPGTGRDSFGSELSAPGPGLSLDRNASELTSADSQPRERTAAEQVADYARADDLTTILTRPIVGALGRSVIGKTTGNLANFAQLAANPEKYYSVTGDRIGITPVEVKRAALDEGRLEDPNPVARFAGQTLPGFVLGGDAALASVPDIGFPLLAGAHQVLDNVARAQKGEAMQWDPAQIGIETAKQMMFNILPMPKTLSKAEGGIVERAARQLGQVGYQTAAFTAADIAGSQKQPSLDDAMGTFALLGAMHLPKISHEIWAGRIESKLTDSGMPKEEAARYANAAMDGDIGAQAFVNKFADDKEFRDAFRNQQKLRSDIRTREEAAKNKHADLVAKAKAGDRGAFEELLRIRVDGAAMESSAPHVAEARRSEDLLPARPGEVRIPGKVDENLRRVKALEALKALTVEPPVSARTPVKPVGPVPAPVTAAVPGNAANVFRVKSPLQRDVQAHGHFDVVELDQLFQGPQDRNRTRAASSAQTEQVFNNFDEEELGQSLTSDRGAPIVMPDGRILAGHGRRNVLIRVYGVGDVRADRYRQFVAGQAAALGLEGKAAGMREPVLVRVADRIENATPEKFAELSNQKQMLGYSDAEKAVKDARRLLSSNMIQALNVTDPDNILAAGNRDFIGAFLDKQDDAAEYWTAEGQAAPALEGRIQRAVLSALVLGDAKAGGESDAAHTVSILVEKAAEYGITPMLKGLTAAAPRLLKIRAGKPEWDLTASLARVMPEIVRAKEAVQSGKFRKIEEYFKQSDWTRKASPAELEIATLLLNSKSAKQVSELLDAYTKAAENHDSTTGDMFGGVLPESTKLDVLRRINNGQSWTTISVEPDRADNGIGNEGNLGGGKSQVVDVAPNERGSSRENDDGRIEGKDGTPGAGAENTGGGRDYRAAVEDDLKDLDALLGGPDGVREPGPKYVAQDMFSVPPGPSMFETELRRIAETRNLAKQPASTSDFEALATKALQSKSEKLADAVRSGTMTEQQAKKEWEATRAGIDQRRQRLERQKDSLRADESERAQGKLFDVPATSGNLLLEEGKPYDHQKISEELAQAHGLKGEDAARKADQFAEQLDFISNLAGRADSGITTPAENDSRPVSAAPRVDDTSVLANRAAIREALKTRDPAKIKALFERGVPVATIIPELARAKTDIHWDVRGFQVENAADAAALFIGLRSPLFEQFAVLFMDSRDSVIEGRVISVGILDASLVSASDVFGNMPAGTVSVKLGHGHPSEKTDPSDSDIKLTRQLIEAGRVAGIPVTDHIITQGHFLSMRENGLVDFNVGVNPERLSRVIPRKEMKGRASIVHPFKDLEGEPDWNVMPRSELPDIHTPEELADVAMFFRAASPDYFHVVGLNTRNKLQAVWRFPNGTSGMDVMKVVARQVGKFAVKAILMDYPGAAKSEINPNVPSTEMMRMFRGVQMHAKLIGVDLLDILQVDAKGKPLSMNESGLMQFEEPRPEWGGKIERVVYHGGSKEIDKFDPVLRGNTDAGVWGAGYYFSGNPEVAKAYGSTVGKYRISIKNPLVVDVSTLSKGDVETYRTLLDGTLSGSRKATAWALKKGYDGVVVTSTEEGASKEGDEIVVFSSSDIALYSREGREPYGVMRDAPAPADPLDKVARVLVGMHAGQAPSRSQAEAFLRSRGWLEKLNGRLDEIIERAQTIAGTKELDYAVGIKNGTLGAGGEQGQQAVRAGSDGSEPGAAGYEPSLAGAAGGAGPGRRQDIRIAGARNLPQPRDYVPAGADADEDQRLGINLAIDRFVKGGRGFLLADGTGVGKTTQLLLIADIWKNRNPQARVLIVTQNMATIKGSFWDDAKRMGISLDGFHLATYDSLKAQKVVTGMEMNKRGVIDTRRESIDSTAAPYDLVLFDEAHNLKNLTAAKTTMAAKYIHKAKHVLYATATPMDSPTGSVYFMAQVTGLAPERIGEMLGFTWKTVPQPDGSTIDQATLIKGMSWDKVLKNLMNMRNEAVLQGAMVRREYPFLGSFVEKQAEISMDDLDFEARIQAYFDGIAERMPPGLHRARQKGQKTFATKHFSESLKIAKAVELAKESIALGRVPIIVSEYVEPSDRLKAPPPVIETPSGKTMRNWKYEVWTRTIGSERMIPGVLGEISKALDAAGITHAKIYGAGDKSVQVQAFQGRKVQAALMTPQSGGTGVNLDDTLGDRPRDMIVISSIFAGDLFQQVLGRISRRNTASPARVIFVSAPGTFGDDQARSILARKVQILTRIQQGDDIDAAGFDTSAGVMVSGPEAGGDEGMLADRGGAPLADRGQGEAAMGEDLPGNKGGVWAPRPTAGGLQDPVTSRAVINLPSLVRLYKEMTGRGAPSVKKKLRIMGGNALGAFYPGNGEIKLLASIFDPVSDARKGELLQQAEDELGVQFGPPRADVAKRYMELLKAEYKKPESQEPRQALATLAHEIGHAFDWLPDRDMSKGNVLGRIAAIHGYMNDMLGHAPAFHNLITDAERQGIRSEAAKQARAQIPPVKGANEAQRKAREKSVDKLTALIYGKLLAEEATRRGLITREAMMEELIAVTNWWKPFDPGLDPSFTEYRYSPPELIADALSVMMNRPDALRKIAPVFEKALFDWMGARAEFQKAWDEIQAELIGGDADKRLVQDILQGFREAESKERENLKMRKTGWRDVMAGIRFGFIDTADPILRKVREFGERDLDAMKNPRYAIEDAIYAGSAHEDYLKRQNREVLEVLQAAGVSSDMFGVYLLARRVKAERGTMANPFGLDPAAASRIMDAFSPEQLKALERAADAFWKVRKALVIDELEQGGVLTDELMDKMSDNAAYATFDLVEYMRARYGSNVGPRIYRQVGTLAAIKNPYVATIQKDLSLISANLRNEARKSVVSFLQEAFPGEIEPAKTKWNGQFQEAVEPSDPNKELLGYLEKGKFKGFYVDKWVAAHFTHEDPFWLRTLGRVLGATMKPFRFAFTDANPGFWAMNLFRDYHATIAHLPGAWSPVGSYTGHWVKGVRAGFQSVFGTPPDVVQEMLKHKMLISMVSRSQEATDEDTILDRLLVQVQAKRISADMLAHPGELISAALDWWTGIGKALERSNQIAAYTWLKQHHPGMHDKEIAHLVRTVASPAFLRKGALYPIYNNLLMFSNANKEGLRAEAEAFRRGKSAWAIKTALYVLLPKMMMWGLKAGAIAAAAVKVSSWLADDKEEKMPGEVSLQDMYGLIPDYDLANYQCAPLGMTKTGKVIYLRFPQMENARMIGGAFWKAMQAMSGDAQGKNVFSDLFSFAGGQVPRLNPAIGLPVTAWELLSGKNPMDDFSQRPMIPDTVFAAQDQRTAAAAAKSLWNQGGGSLLIRFDSEDSRSIQTQLEKVLKMPALGNVFSRFVKVSDRGLWEDVAQIKAASVRNNARERLNVDEMVKGERPYDMEAAKHSDYLKKLLIQKGLREAKSDSTRMDPTEIRNIQILEGASGTAEKVDLIKMLQRRGYLKSANP